MTISAEIPSETRAHAWTVRVSRARPRRRRSRLLLIAGSAWLAVVLISAVFADLLPLEDPNVDIGRGIRTGPFKSWSEPFGTDRLARSMLSRIVFGARASLQTAVASVAIALLIGLLIGVLAGYVGGWVDTLVGVLTDSVLAFPGLVLLMVLAAFLQPSSTTLIVGLSVLAMPSFARLARANTLRIKSAEFVQAARALGAPTSSILVREIVPNVIGVLAAYAGIVASNLVIAEASLSYLGLGNPPPTPSWGNLIADGQSVLRDRPYYVFLPALVLFFTVFSINILGEWVRSRSDGALQV
jgi:peptide/nickel transport system permease protein